MDRKYLRVPASSAFRIFLPWPCHHVCWILLISLAIPYPNRQVNKKVQYASSVWNTSSIWKNTVSCGYRKNAASHQKIFSECIHVIFMAHHHALSPAWSPAWNNPLILFGSEALFDMFETCLGQALRNLNKLLCEPPHQLAHSETLIFNVLLFRFFFQVVILPDPSRPIHFDTAALVRQVLMAPSTAPGTQRPATLSPWRRPFLQLPRLEEKKGRLILIILWYCVCMY